MSGRPATLQLGGSSKPLLLTLARKPGTRVNSHDILPKTGTGRKPTATGVSSRHLCALFLLRGAKPGAWPCSRPCLAPPHPERTQHRGRAARLAF